MKENGHLFISVFQVVKEKLLFMYNLMEKLLKPIHLLMLLMMILKNTQFILDKSMKKKISQDKLVVLHYMQVLVHIEKKIS